MSADTTASEPMLVTTDVVGGYYALADTGLALDSEGFVQVNDYLQTLTDPAIFAAGDIASMVNYKLEKAGVFAVRQGKPLTANLRRAVQGVHVGDRESDILALMQRAQNNSTTTTSSSRLSTLRPDSRYVHAAVASATCERSPVVWPVSGSSATCPADAKSTASCRASAGVCDLVEFRAADLMHGESGG